MSGRAISTFSGESAGADMDFQKADLILACMRGDDTVPRFSG
jgi:hypothetical protein